MSTQLGIYNDALAYIGERPLASVSEDREPKRVLDSYYDDVRRHCLEQGLWNFAIRAVEVTAAGLTPNFGYSYAFSKPSDCVRVAMVSTSETFVPPLLDFRDEANYWYANSSPIYVRYVSNESTEYGGSLSNWTQLYADYVGLRLAVKACFRITGSNNLLEGPEGLLRRERRALNDARSKDAMEEPPGFMPSGTWVTSRGGGGDRRRYGGTSE